MLGKGETFETKAGPGDTTYPAGKVLIASDCVIVVVPGTYTVFVNFNVVVEVLVGSNEDLYTCVNENVSSKGKGAFSLTQSD